MPASPIRLSSRPTGVAHAGLGELESPHGAIDTPQFMPVGMQASVKSVTPADVADAMERTHRWAERSLSAHTRSDQALFGIVQGGVDPDLRTRSVAAIAGLPFDGIAIGGLSVGESKAEMRAMLRVVAEALDVDPRPRYLMGVGSPLDFLVAVEHGVDLVDCVRPTRAAPTGQL